MIWRALIIGDLHWRAENPIARTDHYQAALAEKLLECWELAERHRVDAIIQTGDVFDSPTVALTTIADLMHVFNEAPVSIYTIPGNHDLFGANPETLHRTPLGFLFKLNWTVKNVSGITYTLGSAFPMISGCGYNFATDVDKSQYGVSMDAPGRGPRIHITHGMLLDSPPPSPEVRWTSLEEVAALPNAPDVLINGHDHIGFGIRKVGKTLFINPGALCRLSADVREIDRTVQVALLEIPNNGEPTAKLIPLQSARPGSEVLSRDHLIAEAERQMRRAEFLDLLAGRERQALDLTAMVDEVARADGVGESVRTGALQRLSQAMEALATSQRGTHV